MKKIKDLDFACTLNQKHVIDAMYFVFKDGEGCNVVDLTRHLRVSPPQATVISDDLVRLGLISKKQDKNDKRKAILRITQDGADLCEDGIFRCRIPIKK